MVLRLWGIYGTRSTVEGCARRASINGLPRSASQEAFKEILPRAETVIAYNQDAAAKQESK
jgi:hypothetical protein